MRTLAEEPKSGESSSKNSTGLHLRQAAGAAEGRGCGGESWLNYKIHYEDISGKAEIGESSSKKSTGLHLRQAAGAAGGRGCGGESWLNYKIHYEDISG